MTRGIANRTLAAKIALTVVLGAGAGLAVAPMASATNGNTVHNCRGQYFTTSWQQACTTAGAGATGQYISTAACDYEGDPSMNIWRYQGDRAVVPGSDCTFKVTYVDTVFR